MAIIRIQWSKSGRSPTNSWRLSNVSIGLDKFSSDSLIITIILCLKSEQNMFWFLNTYSLKKWITLLKNEVLKRLIAKWNSYFYCTNLHTFKNVFKFLKQLIYVTCIRWCFLLTMETLTQKELSSLAESNASWLILFLSSGFGRASHFHQSIVEEFLCQVL